jgi:hypothetical protein
LIRRPLIRIFIWLFALGCVVFVVIQFVRPPLTNPPVTAEIQAPAEVKQILRNRCYQCHSNETELPLLDNIVPAYWIATHDVKVAREHLNFSEIGKLPFTQQRASLIEGINFIQMGAMPLPAYLRVHPNSGVTDDELAVLRGYFTGGTLGKIVEPADTRPADQEYAKWVGMGNKPATQVRLELNGLAFMPDYKNWMVVSSTDRWDNKTMREILGNDIAIKAIAEKKTDPWPDGTAFAKVAWKQQPDGLDMVRTGAFVQVELMIKDSHKYASTVGWGWGRWRGTDLKPYGKAADFDKECVSCHEPVAKKDYVYTLPLRGQQ